MGPGYESEEDKESRLESEAEWQELQNDPYSKDEKENMASSEFFNDDD